MSLYHPENSINQVSVKVEDLVGPVEAPWIPWLLLGEMEKTTWKFLVKRMNTMEPDENTMEHDEPDENLMNI